MGLFIIPTSLSCHCLQEKSAKPAILKETQLVFKYLVGVFGNRGGILGINKFCFVGCLVFLILFCRNMVHEGIFNKFESAKL